MYTVKEVKKHKWRFACDACGSEDIELKMWCRWDKVRQQWVFSDDPEADFAWCPNCQDERYASDIICEEITDGS